VLIEASPPCQFALRDEAAGPRSQCSLRRALLIFEGGSDWEAFARANANGQPRIADAEILDPLKNRHSAGNQSRR